MRLVRQQQPALILLLAIALLASPAYAGMFSDAFSGGSKKESKREPRSFLPPVASINPIIQPQAQGDNEIEAVSLAAVSSPVLGTRPKALKISNDLGIRTSTDEYQALLSLQRELEEADLKVLWDATVERNPVIRFSLEKLNTPPELGPKKSSMFLRKSLSTLVTGAMMGGSMIMPGAGGFNNYNQMGMMAAGDAIRNAISGQGPKRPELSATEQIQLAGLVDELQAKLIQSYHDYKNTLQSLTSAHVVTVRENNLYSKALSSKSSLASLASATAYYKALSHETQLRQKAKIHRLQLERLAGIETVSNLQLSVAVSSDIVEEARKKEEVAPKTASKQETPKKETPDDGILK